MLYDTFAGMDVRRESDRYVAELDLPGVDPGSIDITYEDGSLTVRAERARSREAEDHGWVVRERSHEAVVRRFDVGDAVDADAIGATFHDGVLTLTLPLSEQARSRKIAISGGSGELPAGSGTGGAAGTGKA